MKNLEATEAAKRVTDGNGKLKKRFNFMLIYSR